MSDRRKYRPSAYYISPPIGRDRFRPTLSRILFLRMIYFVLELNEKNSCDVPAMDRVAPDFSLLHDFHFHFPVFVFFPPNDITTRMLWVAICKMF